MPSSYPGAFDASFPGWPYEDNIEYILAAYANSWVSALQAIESTIGFGTGAVAANPLYSTTFNTLYNTVAARMTATENRVGSLPPLDTNVNDVQPVGLNNVLGATGKLADAGHAHQGVHSVNGRSGDVTIITNDFGAAFSQAGQLLVGSGNGTSTLLNKGSAGQSLMVGGAGPSGLQWGAPMWSPGDVKWTTSMNVDGTNWLNADGSAVSRATYANLFSGTTFTLTATANSSSTTFTGVSGALFGFITAGQAVEGAGLPYGTTVVSSTVNTLTLTQRPTSNGSVTLTVLPFGQGTNGGNNFNVVDLRGRTPFGIGGSGSNSQPFFGLGASSAGGEANHQLSVVEMAQHGHNPVYQPGAGFVSSMGQPFNGAFVMPGNGSQFGNEALACDFGGFESSATGSNVPHNNMPPYVPGLWLVHI